MSDKIELLIMKDLFIILQGLKTESYIIKTNNKEIISTSGTIIAIITENITIKYLKGII